MSDKPVTAFVGDGLAPDGNWSKWLPDRDVVAFGHPEGTTDDIVALVEDVVTARPATIVLSVGTNDLSHRHSVERTVRNVESALVYLHQRLPDARILAVSLPPRGREFAEHIKDVNRHLWQFAATQKVHYLDLWHALALEDGELNPLYSDDRLRLNVAGQEMWFNELVAALERVEDLPPLSRPIRLPDLLH
jgi:lysophospholipase L1-like esterase